MTIESQSDDSKWIMPKQQGCVSPLGFVGCQNQNPDYVETVKQEIKTC